MRYLICLSLLATLLLFSCATSNSRPLLKKSPYDPAISTAVWKLDGKKKKPKHVKHLETAFQNAQRADLLAADSLLNLAAPDRWLYINALHRRIQERQTKINPLLPLRADDGYKPDLLLVADISDRESASRKAAATYLYEHANALLTETASTGRKQPSRDAYATLRDLKTNYYSYWENANTLIDSAYLAGQAHILLENDPGSGAWGGQNFRQNAGPVKGRTFNNEWLLFYENPDARAHFDFRVKSRLTDMIVWPESRWESTRTESKQIEVGHKEVRDSTGKVIERTPIYETVSATVTEVHISKQASATLYVEVFEEYTGGLLHTQPLNDIQRFDETFVYVSGDERALSCKPFTTIGYASAPSDWFMQDRLVDNLRSSMLSYSRKVLAHY